MTIRDREGNPIGDPRLGSLTYEFDNFSGSQISVMIGDVVIDEATSIQFSVQNSKTPVWGYADHYYAFTADGHIFVQGTLSITFKESGYLLYPIKRFVNRTDKGQGTSPRYSVNEDGSINQTYHTDNLLDASKEARRRKTIEANVEQTFGWDLEGNTPEARRAFNRRWKELEALPDDQFEHWAEVYEDAIWYGSDKNNSMTRDKLFSKSVRKKPGIDITDEEILSHRRADQYPEVDIWIVYGDTNNHGANHTVKKLMDVEFTGCAQVIESSGQPISEVYNFIAKNIV